LESAKTQKWLPNEAVPGTDVDEFRPYVPAAAGTFEPNHSPVVGAPEFRVQNGYWEDMLRDPDFQRDYYRRVGEEVRRRLEKEFESLKSQYLEEGKNEGIALGLGEGRQELLRLQARLDQIASEIVLAKETLMRSHEAELTACLRHLIKQFMVATGNEVLPAIEAWVGDVLEEFRVQGAITVYVAPKEFEKFQPTKTAGTRWKLASDEKLKEGEVRCQCDSGGAVFTRPDQWAKLEKILHQHFPNLPSQETK
jgi:flagellar biosynthesis/type III secretory pathway protein FliH